MMTEYKSLLESAPDLYVHAVIYDGYFPREVDSLWTTEDLAGNRRNELNSRLNTDMWRVVPMRVYGSREDYDAANG